MTTSSRDGECQRNVTTDYQDSNSKREKFRRHKSLLMGATARKMTEKEVTESLRTPWCTQTREGWTRGRGGRVHFQSRRCVDGGRGLRVKRWMVVRTLTG